MNHFLKALVFFQSFLIILLILFLSKVIVWDHSSVITGWSLDNPFEDSTLVVDKPYNNAVMEGSESDDFSERADKKNLNNSLPQFTSLSKNSELSIDLERIRLNSPLVPQEIYDLEIGNDLWGYFKDSTERLSGFQKIDKDLTFVNYRSDNFKNSKIYQLAKLTPKTRIYVLLEMVKPINAEIFYTLKGYGFDTVPGLKRENYYRKFAGVFYVPTGKIKSVANSQIIRNIYILEKYTGLAKYKLGIKSPENTDSLEFKISYPYSKPGLKMFDHEYSFEGSVPVSPVDYPEKNLLVVTTPVKANALYLFSSEYKVSVDLEENLKRSLLVGGKGILLKQYLNELEGASAIKEIFTRPGEKIVTSDYVDNIVRQINTDMDLSGIWKQISFILDKDIVYDWQKRELFFSGNLTYYNIKDMYLNVKELSEKKVGACTERTSLEIAILRKLGIAARSATRLYHIFTEIYVPNKGWLTTSLILNEIPLCHSYNENMAYFVEWNQNFPIRLKWEGGMVPSIVKGLFRSLGLARR